jgi:hypothetical protein
VCADIAFGLGARIEGWSTRPKEKARKERRRKKKKPLASHHHRKKRANVMDRTASPWKEAMTAARKGESGSWNVNPR